MSNVDLVVLSACETGLGKSAGGEGVLGLQRAFQLAGAKTCVTSLWKVDDTATQVLMAEFYKNLWQKKLGKLNALRQAQLAMIRRYDPHENKLTARGLDLPDAPRDVQRRTLITGLPSCFPVIGVNWERCWSVGRARDDFLGSKIR